jgi:hypothetical protein
MVRISLSLGIEGLTSNLGASTLRELTMGCWSRSGWQVRELWVSEELASPRRLSGICRGLPDPLGRILVSIYC